MAKDRLVIFTENGARIIKDPTIIAELKYSNNTLLNPKDLPKNKSPSFWKKNGGNVEIHTDKQIKNIVKTMHGKTSLKTKSNIVLVKVLFLLSFIINIVLMVKLTT